MTPRIAALVAAGSALFLAAFSYPTVLTSPQGAPAPSFTFVDARPGVQLKTGFESLFVGNCAYSSGRIGARDMTPDPAIVVRDLLALRLNDRLSGHTLELRNLVLHFNSAAASRATVAKAYSGALPNALNNVKTVGCAPDDLRGGYVANEVAEGLSPVILVIDVDLDGQRVHSRCVVGTELPAPPRKGQKPEELHAKWNGVVDEAFRCGLDRLVTGLEQKLPGAPSS
jgi:hypothetical protein